MKVYHGYELSNSIWKHIVKNIIYCSVGDVKEYI